jgi:hypothetical protein
MASKKKADKPWSESWSKNMMANYIGGPSDVKNVRNVLSRKGINKASDQLHYMAEKEIDAASRPRKVQNKKNVKRGAK